MEEQDATKAIEATETDVQVDAVSFAENVKTQVADGIKNSQEDVLNKVVTQLVDTEVEIRKNLILEGLKNYDDVKDKLSKIKPDVLAYDETGKVASQNFSKAKIDEKQKLEKQFKEIQTALNLAIEKGDYKKLQKK